MTETAPFTDSKAHVVKSGIIGNYLRVNAPKHSEEAVTGMGNLNDKLVTVLERVHI